MSGDSDWATRIAARIGQAVGLCLILFGLWQFFAIRGLGGIWMALIGWFLLDAATASYVQADLAAGLSGLRVRDIMSEQCRRVDGRISLQEFADDYILRTGARCFVVEDNGSPAGLVTPTDLAGMRGKDWRRMTVNQLVRPFTSARVVSPETPVLEALRLMGRGDVNQLPVMHEGRVEGMLSRGRMLQLLEGRAQLSM
jgi:CBS domain-containing protein